MLLFFSKSAYLIDPLNSWYTLSYADILQKIKKVWWVCGCDQQTGHGLSRSSRLLLWMASALLYAEKPAEAIKVYDKLETKTGINKNLSMQKARLYQRMNKNDKAVVELLKLIDSNPAGCPVLWHAGRIVSVDGREKKKRWIPTIRFCKLIRKIRSFICRLRIITATMATKTNPLKN